MKQLILHLFYVTSSLVVQAQDPAYPSPPAPPQNIIAAEYFLDTDPGYGAGTPIAINPQTSISNISVTVNTGRLSRGRHWLFIRTKNQSGEWSQTFISEFSTEPLVVIPDTVAFANTFVGDVTGVEVVVRNYSSSAYSITGLDVASPFSSDATFPINVNAGESEIIFLEFTPTSTGTFVDSVRIHTTAGDIGAVLQGVAMSVVPVTLISFSATASGHDVRLTWTTTNEEALSHFIIERSTDGLAFSNAGTHEALNRAGQQHYEYLDRLPAAGANFYRLKMVDRDGRFVWSEIRKVVSGGVAALNVFPNPVLDRVTVTGLEPGGQLRLVTTDGKLVRLWKANDAKAVLEMSNVRSGLYILRYDYKGVHHEIKIMKQ